MWQISVPKNFEEAWKFTKLFFSSPHDILYFTITYCGLDKTKKKKLLKCTLTYSLVTAVSVVLKSVKKNVFFKHAQHLHKSLGYSEIRYVLNIQKSNTPNQSLFWNVFLPQNVLNLTWKELISPKNSYILAEHAASH